MPHPYLVPVRPTCSRITHSSGVLGSTSMLCDCPLMVRATICIYLPAHPSVSLHRQLARDEFLLARFFAERASGVSLPPSTKVAHRNCVNRSRCHREIG